MLYIYTYVHGAKRRARSQKRYPAQNNASELSLHRNITAKSSARIKVLTVERYKVVKKKEREYERGKEEMTE